MPVYAVGDVQGCFATLEALLTTLAFDASRDELFLVGDLVNRGPRSLDVLRWAKAMAPRVRVVLGNHDVHLIRRSLGLVHAKKRDTVEDVLGAPDAKELIGWLRAQPFVIEAHGHAFVHAGFLPQWTLADALEQSATISAVLQSDTPERLLTLGAEHENPEWKYFLHAVTNVRVCNPQGVVDFEFDGGADDAVPPYAPWFRHRQRKTRDHKVVFGHWSALGVHREAGVVGLDSGCVWGKSLTALRLDDGFLVSEPAREVPRK